jgi:hypothetical protein
MLHTMHGPLNVKKRKILFVNSNYFAAFWTLPDGAAVAPSPTLPPFVPAHVPLWQAPLVTHLTVF